MQTTRTMRLAVVQCILRQDPRGEMSYVRAGGTHVGSCGRRMTRVQGGSFPEGMTCSPHKLALSVDGPEKIGPSDWDRFPWTILQEELVATAALAGELGLWIALGSVHRLTWPNRPYNSLYVISDRGTVATCSTSACYPIRRCRTCTRLDQIRSPLSLTDTVSGVRLAWRVISRRSSAIRAA